MMENQFYTKVMSIPLVRGLSTPQRSRQLPKKEKKIKALKQVPDVFRVVLEADSGRDPHHQQKFYQTHLAKLTKSQLKEIVEKVKLIREHFFDEHEAKHEMNRVKEYLEALISKQLMQSEQNTVAFLNRIKSKLDLLCPQVEGDLYRVSAGTYLLSDFIEKFFGEELLLYDAYVAAHEIIPDKEGQSALEFLKEEMKLILR